MLNIQSASRGVSFAGEIIRYYSDVGVSAPHLDDRYFATELGNGIYAL